MLGLGPEATAAIIASFVTGVFSLLTLAVVELRTYLSRRADERRSEREWFRHQLLTAYSDCLFHLHRMVDLGKTRPKIPIQNSTSRTTIWSPKHIATYYCWLHIAIRPSASVLWDAAIRLTQRKTPGCAGMPRTRRR